MTIVLRGGCLCGGVRYEVTGAIVEVALCHCRQCRKAQGGAFAVNAPIDRSRLRWIDGEERLRAFESSPGKRRVFCGECGSPVYSARVDLPSVIRLRVGTLDEPLEAVSAYHIFARDRLPWIPTGDFPKYDARPPVSPPEPER